MKYALLLSALLLASLSNAAPPVVEPVDATIVNGSDAPVPVAVQTLPSISIGGLVSKGFASGGTSTGPTSTGTSSTPLPYAGKIHSISVSLALANEATDECRGHIYFEIPPDAEELTLVHIRADGPAVNQLLVFENPIEYDFDPLGERPRVVFKQYCKGDADVPVGSNNVFNVLIEDLE